MHQIYNWTHSPALFIKKSCFWTRGIETKEHLEQNKITCDSYFCWPFGCSIQNTLFCCFCILYKIFFRNIKHFLDNFKHLWSIFLSNLHSFLHSTNNILCFVFCTMFGTFLSCSWNERKGHNYYWKLTFFFFLFRVSSQLLVHQYLHIYIIPHIYTLWYLKLSVDLVQHDWLIFSFHQCYVLYIKLLNPILFSANEYCRNISMCVLSSDHKSVISKLDH